MNKPAQRSEAGGNEAVDRYVADFQRRHPAFQRAQHEDTRLMKYDVVSQLFREHFLFGEKTTYDAALQGMLTNAERERLQTDPAFTQAWRIFVDLCWLKKKLIRAALILAAIIAVMAAVLLCFLALPYVAGPEKR